MLQGTKFVFFFFLLFAIENSYGQIKKHTISGYVQEVNSGEQLIGANVYIDNQKVGAVTNEYGFYSITLPEDSVTIIISFIGYEPSIHQFYLEQDTVLQVQLLDAKLMKEVVVSGNNNKERINSTQMGVEEVTTKEAKEIAAMFGEVDMIKVLQLKPGVQSGIEGSSGIYVRGGSADQNHFILDEATIYNPSHLLGLFSTFNSDVVKHVKLYKAGFPAQFGGRLSSVVDVRMREGNRKKFHISGGLGLISARLMVEGPLKKDKGAFIVSARRTYADLFTALMNKGNEGNANWSDIPDYNFYDINVKLNYDISKKDRLFLSGYFGGDGFKFRGERLNFGMNWGNIAGTLRWNRTISQKMFANTSLVFSNYTYQIETELASGDIELSSGIRDVNLKTDFLWLPSTKHELRFGGNATYHRFSVGNFKVDNVNSGDIEMGALFHASELGLYLSDDWTINSKLKILAGLRLSGFVNEGKFYGGIEPRTAVKYSIHKRVSLKASYARMYQYLHLVATSGVALPTNIWYPSNQAVKPQISDLISTSVSFALGADFYINVEGYYKWLHQQIDFRDGARLFANEHLDQEFIFGRGYSYGGEVYIEKKNGPIRGWIGYTLSWAWRQFDHANGGEPYHPREDRRHDLSAVVTWDLPTGPKFPLTVSASWVYGTGVAITVPTKRYIQADITATNPFQFIPIYSKRGGFRLPDYHRLDLSLVWKLYPLSKKRFQSNITFSVYNVYDRRNPFFLYMDAIYADKNNGANTTQMPQKFEAKVVSLFPVIPSITWNFKW